MAKKKQKTNLLQIIVLILIAVFIVWFFLRRESKLTVNADVLVNQTSVAAISATPSATASVANELPKGKEIQASILMYHHIGPLPEGADDIRKGLTVSAATFEAQMKKLKDGGYNVVTLNELYNKIASSVPEKTVVLTFDDGYEDNSSVALPILQKYGFHGTFFIITSKIGNADYMSEDQIKDLAKNGNEIGSHTVYHIGLDTVKGTTLDNEIKDSKIALDKLLSQNTTSFCYPAGKFSDEAKADLLKDGYRIAVTTEASKGTFSTDNIYQVSRYRVNPGSSLSFLPK
jgi:peptidoglycan/xylan/chitin deacetylase (PgdA/CDA1 family)